MKSNLPVTRLKNTNSKSGFKHHLHVYFVLLMTMALMQTSVNAQPPSPDYNLMLKVPKQYSILRSSEKILVDGKDNEQSWNRAPWTVDFTDIVTGVAIPDNIRAKCKLLWDSAFLYVFATFREQDIWASINQTDYAVFQDNAFEIFINPDGSTHHYFEFQINAFETVADLYMPKPYRNGGRGLSSWDIKGLQKAVHVTGTINNPADRDTQWNIELAIPFASFDFRFNQVKPGTVWRMNFSRVQWQLDTVNHGYRRKRNSASGKLLSEHYSVWSPHGLVNLHYPERWGYVLFTDTIPAHGFLNNTSEQLKLSVWKYYYLQQQYFRKKGRYAATTTLLDAMAPTLPGTGVNGAGIQMFVNEKQFYIQGTIRRSNEYFTVDHKGEFRTEKRKR